MSEPQTVSEALDFFLDYGPADDKHIEHLQVAAEEASQKDDKNDKKQMMQDEAQAIIITYRSKNACWLTQT